MHLPTEQLWAIEPSTFESMLATLRGLQSAPPSADARRQSPEPPTVRRIAQAGIIDIVGTLQKRSTWLTWLYGGTTYGDIRSQLAQALADPSIREIILRIDSPGGSVAGVGDTADEIAAANLVKPVTAFIEDYCCSAAYYLASQAGKVFANRSATVGSIGTLLVVYDWSAALQRAGIKPHVFTTGRYKGAGVFGSELTEDQAASLQRYIDAQNAHFQSAVARTRRLNPKQLDEVFNAALFVGPAAVDAGLVDKICRLREQEAVTAAARYEADTRERLRQDRAAADRAASDNWKRFNRHRF